MKTVIIGLLDAHSLSMVDAFVAGYNESLAIYNPKNILHITSDDCHITGSYYTPDGLEIANNFNSPLAIKSTSEASSVWGFIQDPTRPEYSSYYPNVTLFMPAGANAIGEIYTNPIIKQLCITGAGDLANETADDVEFIWEDPIYSDEQDHSSFSNPYIAAQLLFIAESCNCSIWEARKRARQTASQKGIFHETDGYGFINIQKAIQFSFKDFQQKINAKIYRATEYKPFFLKQQKYFILQKGEPKSSNYKILAHRR